MSNSVIVDPCNVILHPGTAYNIQYPDTFATTILNSMVVENISAYQETISGTLYNRNLTLGASSNVNMLMVSQLYYFIHQMMEMNMSLRVKALETNQSMLFKPVCNNILLFDSVYPCST